MTPHGWYDFAKDFASPLATTLAAAVAATIAWRLQHQQILVAKSKLKLDMFDKKYALFETSTKYIAYLMMLDIGIDNLDGNKYVNFQSCLGLGEFVLNKKTNECMRACDEMATRVIKKRQKLDKDPNSCVGDPGCFDDLSALRRRLADAFQEEMRVGI